MSKATVLAICPSDWLGVRRSVSLGADVFADIACAREAIRQHDPAVVRFGGYDRNWRDIARFAKQRGSRVVVSIQHTPAFHEFAPDARAALRHAISDFRAGLIDALESPHQGVAATLSMLGVPCAYRRNAIPCERRLVAKAPSLGPGIHIGVFGTGMPWKNMDTQLLAAALACRGSRGTLHVQRVADAAFLESLEVSCRTHPVMEPADFERLLASMTLNLAVSFTETFGYLPVESFLLGVPCLFSPMTAAFSEVEPEGPLWRCRVDRVDDPAFLAERIDDVLAHRDEVVEAGRVFCERHRLQEPSSEPAEVRPDRAHGLPDRARDALLQARRRLARARTDTLVRLKTLRPRISRALDARVAGFARAWTSSGRFDATLRDLERIRSEAEVLAITPQHDGIAWLGVNRATHALFPVGALDLPLELAYSRARNPSLQELSRQVSALRFSQVILSGFPSCTEGLARSLHERGVRVGGLYHGFLAECADPELADAFGTVLRLRREGVLSKLACNKQGLPETIRSIAELEVHEFIVPTRVPVCERPPRGAGLHIGVLGYDILRKNIHNQIAAALLIEDATVHVASESAARYWGMEHRIQRHPNVMPHGEFVELLGRMDLNLHLSYSESWGQLAAESLALGVPCLIANHSDMFDSDSELRELLVSTDLDDPLALASRIRRVLALRHELPQRLRDHIEAQNRRAETCLREFLAL